MPNIYDESKLYTAEIAPLNADTMVGSMSVMCSLLTRNSDYSNAVRDGGLSPVSFDIRNPRYENYRAIRENFMMIYPDNDSFKTNKERKGLAILQFYAAFAEIEIAAGFGNIDLFAHPSEVSDPTFARLAGSTFDQRLIALRTSFLNMELITPQMTEAFIEQSLIPLLFGWHSLNEQTPIPDDIFDADKHSTQAYYSRYNEK